MSRIQVALGIIYNRPDDTVLLGLRPSGAVQGNKWEFPGGKLEKQETVFAALQREIHEETGIKVESAHPLIRIEHNPENLKLTLHAWCVDNWSGQATSCEGQIIEWVKRDELVQRNMPSVNAAILAAYKLPSLYLVTPDLEKYDDRFLQRAELLIANGVKLLQFRSRSEHSRHRSIVQELVHVCNQHDCRLVYNGSIEEALSVGAHGVHLRSDVLAQTVSRPEIGGLLISAACHSIEQIMHANRVKSDFCVLAPVHDTVTHPGTIGMGWSRFSEIARHSNQPVYALGGISPGELVDAHSHGAHGIAMISGIWQANDPVAALKRVMNSPG